MESIPPKLPEVSTETEAAFSPTVVGHCSTLNEAQMVVSLLASFGIEATIDSENYYRLLGSMVPGVEGIRVRVRQLDAEAALEILEQGPEAPTTDDEQAENDSER
jgi:hypothetical protein